MSGFTTETITTTTVKTERIFRVPTVTDPGVDGGVVAAAFTAAWTEYREKMGIPEGAEMPPDTVWFQSKTGQIVISWAVVEVTTT